MPETETIDPKIEPEVQASLKDSAPLDLTDECLKDIGVFIEAGLTTIQPQMDARMERLKGWRKTLGGINPQPPLRTGVSHVSVPLTMWAASVTQANLEQGVLGNRPRLNVKSANASADAEEVALNNKFAKFMEQQMRSSRALNGDNTVTQASIDDTNWGLGAWKVGFTPDNIRNIGVSTDGTMLQAVEHGTAKWMFVAFDDLLYWNGYGTEVNNMPFVGHIVRNKTWGAIKQWQTLGYYYEDTVNAVEKQSNDTDPGISALHSPHDVAEMYLDWDLAFKSTPADGILESIMIDYHMKARKVLRVSWNPFQARRPIVMVQYGPAPRQTDGQGQGVCEILESPQMEANDIHNIGIEAGKRGIAHLTVLKEASGIADELGGDDGIFPGTIATTADPQEDINVVELGNPQAAAQSIALEELNRVYAARLLGLDDTAVGNVAAGKRVPAAIGVPAMKAGQTIGRRAINSLAAGIQESIYLTIELYKKRLPETALLAVFTEEEIPRLMATVFQPDATTTREKYLISVQVQDANIEASQKKAELFSLNQFLLTFNEKLAGVLTALANPQVPEPMRAMIQEIGEKQLNSMFALLNSIDGVGNPDEFLISVESYNAHLNKLRQTLSGGQPAIVDDDQPPEAQQGF